MHQNPPAGELRELLSSAESIAVVGASARPERPSHGVFARLLRAGYRVYPVNPNEAEVLGQRAYGSLAELPERVDIVNVFRRAEHTPDVAREAVQAGARVLWLQTGIWSDEAAQLASAGGLRVVMDECIGVQHSLLGIAPRKGLS
jgi:predicted CoA-binding protein